MSIDIIVGIGHPAHVHFYRNAINKLQSDGCNTLVLTKNREMAINLLNSYDINYDVAGRSSIQGNTLPEMLYSFASYEYDVLQKVYELKPDVVTGIGNIPLAHASSFFDCKSVIFDDSDPITFANRFAVPFSDIICTPERYSSDLGDNHFRYNGYHELAYLHPNWFSPNPDRLRANGIEPNDTYFVVRFIAWNALHDINHSGLGLETKRQVIATLENKGDVYITAEGEPHEEFTEYQTQIPPDLMHDLLYYTDLYIGDSQTMATEAAVLGTPAIRSNSFAGDKDMSNFRELENKYQLLYSTPNEDEAVKLASELSSKPELQATWNERREGLLEDKIDVTSYIVEMINKAQSK